MELLEVLVLHRLGHALLEIVDADHDLSETFDEKIHLAVEVAVRKCRS